MEARRAAEEYEQEDLRLRALRAETEREQRCTGEQKEDGYDRRIIGQFQEERWCIQEERAREQQRLRTLRERRERWQRTSQEETRRLQGSSGVCRRGERGRGGHESNRGFRKSRGDNWKGIERSKSEQQKWRREEERMAAEEAAPRWADQERMEQEEVERERIEQERIEQKRLEQERENRTGEDGAREVGTGKNWSGAREG